MKLKETTVEQNYVFKGRVFNARVDKIFLPNGKPASREVVEHNGGVTVVALTDDDEVIFVRQFRYPYSSVILEIPAGKLEIGEDPKDAGKRELLEETGAVPKEFIDLGKIYPSPGYCAEVLYLYLAKGLTFGEQKLDVDEFLTVEKIPLEKAVEMVLSNEIKDAKTQIGILKVNTLKIRGKI